MIKVRELSMIGAALLAFFSSNARAQSNFNPYPVGERASGMGGAATALGHDAAGSYYNPASLAFVDDDVLAVSTGLYGFIGGRQYRALGQSLDSSFSTLNLVPTAANTVFHFTRRKTPDTPPPWVFCLNVYAPFNREVDQNADVGNGSTRAFSSFKDITLFIGPTIAYRVSPKFSFGITLYLMVHSFSQRVDATFIYPDGILQATVNDDFKNLGLLGQFGVQFRPTDRWSFGLSLRSPSWTFHNSSTTFSRGVAAFNTINPNFNASTTSVTTQRVYPTQLNFGLAWTNSRLTLAADVQLVMPHPYDAVVNPLDASKNIRIDNGFVANAALGLEYKIRPRIMYRMGVFTDLPANPKPVILSPQEVVGDTQSYLFGGTLALAWATEHSSTQFGAIAAGGPSYTYGLDVQNRTFTYLESTGYEWRAMLVISSSYRF